MTNDKTVESFHMIDVGEKSTTKRTAIAQGVISMDQYAFNAIKTNSLPKGNVLALAEVAGISAAKNASTTIPLCHPLALDYARVTFDFSDTDCSVIVTCEASANAKTGVEMESLAGVNGALLAIYDLTKGVCPALEISDVRLNVKKGGKSGLWIHPHHSQDNIKPPNKPLELAGVTCAVLTVSDSVYKGTTTDESGAILVSFLNGAKADVIAHEVLPDECDRIAAFLENCSHSQKLNLVITTGGTGLSSRDVTPEAIAQVCTKTIPGIGELLRMEGYKHCKFSHLSRSVAALIGRTLVIALAGNPRAVTEGIEAIRDILPHALRIAGDNTEHKV